MMFLKIDVFDKKYVNKPITRLITNPKEILTTAFNLPLNAIIHYKADSDNSYGINSNHDLVRAASGHVYNYHVNHLLIKEGHAIPISGVSLTQLTKKYYLSNIGIKPIKDLDRVLHNTFYPIVINYSLLPSLYRYNNTALITYYEWYNIRATIWDKINAIGSSKEHFLIYKLPEILPTKNDFIKYTEEFKSPGLAIFTDSNSLNLLELWRIISIDLLTTTMGLSSDTINSVTLVFIESGKLFLIKLKDLVEWANLDKDRAKLGFYKFLDSLLTYRNSLKTSEIVNEATSVEEDNIPKVNNKIIQLINEKAEANLLSSAEKNGLIKLAEKTDNIIDPKTGKTVAELKIKSEDLKLNNNPIAKDMAVITDKSLLYSSLKQLDLQYQENLAHKAIIETVASIGNSGVILKDIKVKHKNTVATKADLYNFTLQPINGPSSTITFTIPTINPDGSFLAGGVKYRMDRQRGEMPIIKTKPNMVALTSYYGKIFIIRSDNSTNNYAKWILAQLTKRLNVNEGKGIFNLVYGISKNKDIQLPRAYTAVATNIAGFTLQDINDIKHINYNFYFNYNKRGQFFTKEELEQEQRANMIICGKNNNTGNILTMDDSGIIYELLPNHAITLGPLPYLLDENLGNGAIEYSEMSLLNKQIPVGLALCYFYGFENLLYTLKIHFQTFPTNTKIPYETSNLILKFKDLIYVLTINDQSHALLFGGFYALKSELSKLKSTDFNKANAFGSTLSSLGISAYHLRELTLIWDMFLEPITLALLREIDGPTDMFNLLLTANKLLVNDYIPNYSTVRYKGYERLCGIMYGELINAIRNHRSRGVLSDVGVTMKPNAVWLSIIQDASVALVEESNPIHNLKEQEAYTNVGSGGRSTITMVGSTRGFSQHDLGVVSEASPDSSKVGIRAALSPNANIVNLLGMVREYDSTTDGSSTIISSTALISPCVTHDDKIMF